MYWYLVYTYCVWRGGGFSASFHINLISYEKLGAVIRFLQFPATETCISGSAELHFTDRLAEVFQLNLGPRDEAANRMGVGWGSGAKQTPRPHMSAILTWSGLQKRSSRTLIQMRFFIAT